MGHSSMHVGAAVLAWDRPVFPYRKTSDRVQLFSKDVEPGNEYNSQSSPACVLSVVQVSFRAHDTNVAGMSMETTIKEVMTRDYVGVSESDRLREAGRLLREEGVEGAVVLRGNEPVGTIAVNDVLDHVLDGDDETTVGEAMADAVEEVEPDLATEVAADRLVSVEASLLVVTKSSEVLGVVTQSDLIRAIALGRDPDEQREADFEPARATSGNPGEGYSEQGICERCGALTSDLVAFNGQLLCADCRDI